jgi:GNAT superfamily N-acetyltransferase
MDLIIRKATTGDTAAIAKLSTQLGYPISEQDTETNITTISQNENEVILVAVHEEVVGWIHLFHTTRLESGPFCEIGGMVVDNHHQRLGIGRMLVEAAKKWCGTKGYSVLRVRSNVKRAAAHHFYLQTGFKETKQQKVFELEVKG